MSGRPFLSEVCTLTDHLMAAPTRACVLPLLDVIVSSKQINAMADACQSVHLRSHALHLSMRTLQQRPHLHMHLGQFAGRFGEPDRERWRESGAVAAEGHDPTHDVPRPDLAIRLCSPSCDSSASTHSSREEQARSDVSILLGGCGDARHFLATLIDAVAECRSADLTGAWLRFVLNDVQPEVLARAAILMQLLQRAADALPDGTPLVCEPEELSEDAIVALTDLWHVYHAPALLPHAYTALERAMQAIVASKEPPLPWLQATPGSWAHVQNVCDAWLQQKLCMTEMEELMAQSDKARTGPNMTEAYIPDHIRV